MRLAFLVALAMVVAYGAYLLTRPDPPVPKSVAAQQTHECRDVCEQTMILEKLDDTYLKNCRARCDGPPKPNEPIKRITVAPVDHSKTIRDVK